MFAGYCWMIPFTSTVQILSLESFTSLKPFPSSGLAADFSTYVDSVIPQLITGEISLDEIPAIQQSIRDMGADDCIALWQAELDRWNALGT